jgi:MFS family permease
LRHYARVPLLCLMQLMLVIDTSVVNVALPAIKRDLGFSATALTWMITAYALVFGGFATTPAMLVAARVPQGLGAALAAPSTLVLVLAITTPGPQRTRAMSLFVIAIGSGAALGLVLGGVLTTSLEPLFEAPPGNRTPGFHAARALS